MATTATWQSYLPIYEKQYGLPGGLLGALIRAESGGNTNARSPVGAIGLGQLMPGTAQGLGVNPNDPIQNLRGSAMYLSQQLKTFGTWQKALAAYNAGPGAVKKYNGIPPYKETQNYVKRIQEYWKESSKYGMQGALPAAQVAQKPLGPTPVRQTVAGLDPGSLAKMQYAFVDAPEIGSAHINNRYNQQNKLDASYNSAMQKNANIANDNRIAGSIDQNSTGGVVNPGAKGFFKTPNGFVKNRLNGELGYQFLQRLGNKGFGLRNDSGINQTYGGSHTSGSLHYDKRAVDWGNAANSKEKLNSWNAWLQPRKKVLGLQELIWQSPGHYDHLHAGTTS